MAYEQKPGDISVFLETDKRNDKAPDWKGKMITPDGEVLEVALWARGDRGTMLAGSVQVPRAKANTAERFHGDDTGGMAGSHSDPRQVNDLNDEIPF